MLHSYKKLLYNYIVVSFQKVYASPSRRRMDTKGEVEEITYPSVCFHVDNFDEVNIIVIISLLDLVV